MFVPAWASLAALCVFSQLSAALPFGSSAPPPSLLDITIHELTDLLDRGEITSYDLAKLYLKRIDQVNHEINAVLEVSTEALEVARQRDQERALGIIRGPLHGIPILVKDNYATTDDMVTGAGSVCLAKSKPAKEATVVAKLRKAGAIILGKTNLSEFSGGRGYTSEGWSARGNQTYGAYVEHQSACGSSSGSGVAASLGLAAATLGTETSGSISCPAFFNNVVGIKPTVGLTSRFGVVPLTPRQDTTGPLVQSVADAALILDVIAGKDVNDNYTLVQPPQPPQGYTSALNASALQGKRIGAVFVPDNILNETMFVNSKEFEKVFDAALADLELAGAEVVKVDIGLDGIPLIDSGMDIAHNMSEYVVPDFAESLAAYMDILEPDTATPHTVLELIDCMETDPQEFASEYDITGIQRLGAINKTAGSVESWEAYLAAKSLSREILLGPIKKHNLDGLVVFLDIALILSASPGLPLVSVPMGVLGADASTAWNKGGMVLASAPGMPVGLTFVGDQWTEHELIGYAYAYEQVSKKRQELTPYFKIGADLDTILRGSRTTDL